MKIIIEPMSLENSKEIFDFEKVNKEYFESVLPPRPEGYYNFDSFNSITNTLLKECESGECHMHIIREGETGVVIGRINLTVISSENVKKAELGYRIAKEYNGKGIATEAVKIIKELCATKYSINILEAGTSTQNIGSRRVLEKSGFTFVGEEKNVMKINGRWVDGALYECCIEI